MNLPSTQQNLTQSWQMHLWISWFRLPATSTISPGTMSRALTLWTLFLSCRYTLPISGSYSFRASMAFSALRSCRTQWHVSFQHSSCMLVCGHQTWQEITHTHRGLIQETESQNVIRSLVLCWLFPVDLQTQQKMKPFKVPGISDRNHQPFMKGLINKPLIVLINSWKSAQLRCLCYKHTYKCNTRKML